MPETTTEQDIRVHHGSRDKYRVLVAITPSLALVEMVGSPDEGRLAYIAGGVIFPQPKENQVRIKKVVELITDRLPPFDKDGQWLFNLNHPIAPGE